MSAAFPSWDESLPLSFGAGDDIDPPMPDPYAYD